MERRLEIDNRSLVEECLKGDKEALNLFYLRFAPRMLNLIRRYVREENDVEDILHDGFIVAFTRLRSLRDPEKVDYWLASIMKNLSLRFLQEQDVAQLLYEEKDMEDTGAVDNIIDMEVLETLIKKLPPGYQKVFRLSILENKSHKEIARILGIAPNSSSSQLFHAKVMMRQLIMEYKKQAGIWSLLLIGLTAGVAFLIPDLNRDDMMPPIAQAPKSMTGGEGETLTGKLAHVDEETLGNAVTGSNAGGLMHVVKSGDISDHSKKDNHEITEEKQEIDENRIDVGPDMTSGTEKEESAGVVNEKVETADYEGNPEYTPEFADNAADAYDNYAPAHDPASKKNFRSKWSLVAKAQTGVINSAAGSNENVSYDFDPGYFYPSISGLTHGSGLSDFGSYSGMKHRNDFPVSLSLAVSRALNGRFGIEAGLSYTYLRTTFEGGAVASHCRWHYLGIPLRLTFRSFTTGRVKFYGAAGGSVEIPVYSTAHISGDKSAAHYAEGRFSSPVVWTLSGVYGASFKLSEKFELFAEPTVQVYLHNKATVPNLWSDNRVGFSLPIGLRFNW